MNERIFEAIGGADPRLVERSEKRRRSHWKAGLCAAACLTVLAAGYFLPARQTAAPPQPPYHQGGDVTPPDNPTPPDGPALILNGGEVGTLHLLSNPQVNAAPDFLIYVNEEMYAIQRTEDSYAIRPLNPLPEDFPLCGMDILHVDRSPAEAKQDAAEALAKTYAQVDTEKEAYVLDALYLRASNGDEWNSEQAECFFADDRQGGAFVLISRYFLEAEEGHGVRFRDMTGTFQVVSQEEVVPDWMRDLRAVAGRLYPALLSNDADAVKDLLAENASADAYGENVWPEVTVASVDYAPDNDQSPGQCVVSVKHRVSTEDPYDYLTMILVRQDGKWLLSWSGIER